jgi:ATP-dependent helicase/nuclease subunit A
VLARDLLSSPVHGAAVRTSLQQRYRRLLLDEFQDTDPIQVELAVRIAAGLDGGAPRWEDVPVPEGSLFLVGDPKQSIYRFRRADIATYLEAQQRIGEQLVLQTNFRSTKPVLGWINHVFDQLITAEPGSQPAYHPLQSLRDAAPDGHAVTLLGARAHADKPSADDLRAREAADVAAAVHTALSQRWQVADEQHAPDGPRWRDVKLADIAVLVPGPHVAAAPGGRPRRGWHPLPGRSQLPGLPGPRGPRPAHRRPGGR